MKKKLTLLLLIILPIALMGQTRYNLRYSNSTYSTKNGFERTSGYADLTVKDWRYGNGFTWGGIGINMLGGYGRFGAAFKNGWAVFTDMEAFKPVIFKKERYNDGYYKEPDISISMLFGLQIPVSEYWRIHAAYGIEFMQGRKPFQVGASYEIYELGNGAITLDFGINSLSGFKIGFSAGIDMF